MMMIHYQVNLYSAEAHLFEVVCTISAPNPAGQQVSLPTWIPGSYLIRDFAKNIISINASAEGENIEITKIDKNNWRCAPCKKTLKIRYQVYAFDLSVRSAYFDTSRAYFNGTSLFLMVHGQEAKPCHITIQKPEKSLRHWQIATSLTIKKLEGRKLAGKKLTDKKQNLEVLGDFEANDYLSLIDYPVEIGELSIATFKAQGIPHRIVISGKHQADIQRIAKDLKKICETQIKFWGEAPFKQYDFLLHAAADDQYGGLEHSNSTSLICPRSWLPTANENLNQKNYQDYPDTICLNNDS